MCIFIVAKHANQKLWPLMSPLTNEQSENRLMHDEAHRSCPNTHVGGRNTDNHIGCFWGAYWRSRRRRFCVADLPGPIELALLYFLWFNQVYVCYMDEHWIVLTCVLERWNWVLMSSVYTKRCLFPFVVRKFVVLLVPSAIECVVGCIHRILCLCPRGMAVQTW